MADPTEVITGPSTTEGQVWHAGADRFGVLTVVWSRGDTLYASQRSPSGLWTGPEMMCVASEQCWESDMGVSSRGRVTVVFAVGRGGGEIAVRTKPPGQPWNPRVVLTKGPGRHHGFHPTLSVARNGAAAVSWVPISGDGTVVARKTTRRPWTHARFARFDGISGASGLSARGNGAVLLVGDRTTSVETSTDTLLRAYRPGHGWLPTVRLGSHGGWPGAVATFGGHGRAAVVWTRWSNGEGGRSALYASEMGPRFRWATGHRLTRWFGENHPATAQDLVFGRDGRIGLSWFGRGQRYSSWRPGQGDVDTVVPLAGQHSTSTHAANHNAHGDLALTWYRERPDPDDKRFSNEDVHVSLSHAGSTSWRSSSTLGTATCGRGGRGDLGCRPVAAGVLPDGSAAVVWFNLDNKLVARLVH